MSIAQKKRRGGEVETLTPIHHARITHVLYTQRPRAPTMISHVDPRKPTTIMELSLEFQVSNHIAHGPDGLNVLNQHLGFGAMVNEDQATPSYAR